MTTKPLATRPEKGISTGSEPVHMHSLLSDHHKNNQQLYNDDIAPREGEGTWKAISLFNWWMSAWHSLGGYAMAVGFMALGLNGWQAMAGMALGMVGMWFASNLMGIAGQKVGVPFPVFARITFGVKGANLPATLRAIVAVCWYGIQTFLASHALNILVVKLIPAAGKLDTSGVLGLTWLGWICLLTLWFAQLAVLYRGMETVRKLSDFAGPTIWVAMIALALWTLSRANWKIEWSYSIAAQDMSTSHIVITVLGTASITLAFMAGPMLNFADFTRLSVSPRSVKVGNALGLLVNGIAFAIISVVIGIASAEVYGSAVTDPILLLKELDSVSLLIISTVAIAVAQVGVNIICNFVSASFDFAHLRPGLISFRTGGVITAILSIVVMPWKMYSTPAIINLFLGGVGALIGPLFGVMMVDYYLIKRQKIAVSDLYSSFDSASYHYRNGFNFAAILSFLVAGLITITIALAPLFADLAPFSWPIGVGLGAVFYFVAAKLRA